MNTTRSNALDRAQKARADFHAARKMLDTWSYLTLPVSDLMAMEDELYEARIDLLHALEDMKEARP